MEINEVITQLKDKFGDRLDITKATGILNGLNLKNFSFQEIVEKIKNGGGILGDLDGDGVVESPIEELKGEAKKIFGKIF